MNIIVAIDGPSAAGKGTLSKVISREYGLPHLDTGKLYRATAARMKETGETAADASSRIQDADLNRPNLRDPEISQLASVASADPAVRRALFNYQVFFSCQASGAVLDGRDIGTVIAPQADVKFFLTASDECRARRRTEQLRREGTPSDYAQVLAELRQRDSRDASRSSSPTLPANDAIVLDTSDLSLEETIEIVLSEIDKKVAQKRDAEAREMKWHLRFLEMAELVAGWSKDPSTKVGAVIVDDQRLVLGVGYNGFPRGVKDTPDRLENRDIKYMIVQHAEANAIANCSSSTRGATCYVTHAPCGPCMGILAQHGIKRIVTRPTPAGLAERLKLSYQAADMIRHDVGIEVVVIQ